MVPDINFTPPLEFPSDGVHVKILHAIDSSSANNSTIFPFLDIANNNKIMSTNESMRRLQEHLQRHFDESVVKSISNSQPINVIAKISENFTENKYYNNQIEKSLNVTNVIFTLIIFTILSISVLACSALCLKKVEK